MNKKGIVEKAIEFPALIWIILLMIIFLLLASFMPNKPAELTIKTPLHYEDPLLKTISLNADGKNVDMTIFDGYLLLENQDPKFFGSDEQKTEFKNQLKNIVDSQNPCLILAKGKTGSPIGATGTEAIDDFYIRFTEKGVETGNIGNTPLISNKYKAEKLTNRASFRNNKGEIIYIEYYYGRCL